MTEIQTALIDEGGNEAKHRFRLRLFTALSFAITLLAGGAIATLVVQMHQMDKRKETELIAASQAAMIEEHLSHAMASTYALAAVVRQGGGRIDRFEALGEEMLKMYGGISSLQLAPRGVISAVVPLAPNKAALGHDLLHDRARSSEAMLALESKSLTLAGPLELRQGGIAVAGRLPVFLPQADGREHFWGFTIALLRVPDLLAMSGLQQLPRQDYDFRLTHVDAGGTRRTIAESTADGFMDAAEQPVRLPNNTWHLSIAPASRGLAPYMPLAAGFLVLLAACLAALFTYSSFRHPLLLQRKVYLRTRELADSILRLKTEAAEKMRINRMVEQFNRLYSLQSRINAAIMRIADRDALLREVCALAVENGSFSLARVAVLDEHGDWHWQAGSGRSDEIGDTACPVAAWLATDPARVLVLADEGVQADGPRSHAALRLRQAGRTVAVLSLHADAPDFFNTQSMLMLVELSDDLSFALDNIERDTQRRRTEDKLRKLSRAVEQSVNAVMITDRQGVIEYVNPWFTLITGYTAEEAIGHTPRLLKSADTSPETWKRLWSTVLSGGEWRGELRNTRKNGERYWSQSVISPLKDESGNITHFVAVSDDVSTRKQAEQTIRRLAFHDALTGLPNRRRLIDALQKATAQPDARFGLMLFDLDRFKTVNDSLGHEMGDLLLQEIAHRLDTRLREGDLLARMGGDEFGMIVRDVTQPEDMARLADDIAALLSEPFHLDGHELFVTVSTGITMYPADGGDAETLVRNADTALYRAKDGGRNGSRFFTVDMSAESRRKLRLESALRGALERGELLLVYQPQADVVTGRIRGCEALVRWKHAELGMVSPAEFIPLAEETGLILPIGEWILRTACAQAREWELAGQPVRIAVNLSAIQFHHGDLAATVAGILAEHSLPPELLELELTEGILMTDSARGMETLGRLHDMGVQISIDDFGTGYSSLSYLKRLPIQVLKIDQSFVRDIHTDPDDRAIVTAVIALAHSMKLKVVAEGVETDEQYIFLRDHRCDMLQGYLFSRPVPAQEVWEMMAAETAAAT
ncbi:bifunctional diguanylate cyclase/phosphodiesterase [Noviherbaspirillum aridicola]|uniref:PAS domain S-box-containing protein/diguanylate cyclase (GGDEF)-like protein n=1 Tax=Noviherbaspirillum aridicola TaxID=2849687 RepID=A0ABQ4Q6T1_9BURK|nr:EAL domain-containing protein [Noviherbaspirillum aridicola]GIZ52716.1 hypothetical protein NCCP691_27300 [Noviherbaspirillum aridicola]